MFLHELGHMMKGNDGRWLLPDDGKDQNRSHVNSQKIEDFCGSEIKRLRKEGATITGGGKIDDQQDAARAHTDREPNQE